MKIEINCKEIKAGGYKKLVFDDFLFEQWDEYNLWFCVHGEKLRWFCDECDEYFSTKEVE